MEQKQQHKPLTATQEKMRQKKMAVIKADLQSDDETIVLAALKLVKQHGDPTVIDYLCMVLNKFEDDAVQKEAKNILFSLNESENVPALIEAAGKAENKDLSATLLAAIWESGLDAFHELDNIIQLSLKADYDELIEIMTIIDNIDFGAETEPIEQNIKVIQEHLTTNQNDDRSALLVSIVRILRERILE